MAKRQKSQVVSISLPTALAKQVAAQAAATGSSRSQLITQALEQYLWLEEWRKAQAYGFEQALTLGLKPADVEQLIDEYRDEQTPSDRR